jgi:hypothetical protein
MSEIRRMWPDEIAEALKGTNEAKAEVAKLQRKLSRIKKFITEYGSVRYPAVGHVVYGDLQRVIIDIIDSEEKKA